MTLRSDLTPEGREQKLIDILFECVMLVTSPGHAQKFQHMKREKVGAWVREQLEGCGFHTEPCGASWGVLTTKKEDRAKCLVCRVVDGLKIDPEELLSSADFCQKHKAAFDKDYDLLFPMTLKEKLHHLIRVCHPTFKGKVWVRNGGGYQPPKSKCVVPDCPVCLAVSRTEGKKK